MTKLRIVYQIVCVHRMVSRWDRPRGKGNDGCERGVGDMLLCNYTCTNAKYAYCRSEFKLDIDFKPTKANPSRRMRAEMGMEWDYIP